MYKELICLMFLFSCTISKTNSADQGSVVGDNCQFGQSQLQILLNSIYSEKIVETARGGKVYLSAVDTALTVQISSLANDTLIVREALEDKTLPFIKLVRVVSHSSGSVEVPFYARQAGYEYNGRIYLKCALGSLIYDRIEYISAVN